MDIGIAARATAVAERTVPGARRGLRVRSHEPPPRGAGIDAEDGAPAPGRKTRAPSRRRGHVVMVADHSSMDRGPHSNLAGQDSKPIRTPRRLLYCTRRILPLQRCTVNAPEPPCTDYAGADAGARPGAN
eukprot:scaffold910_cov396-Prasinococcus_capsulatus_cf.AAC.20